MSHTSDHINIYVKGCPDHPTAVINRLIYCGGESSSEYRTIDLMNPHNIFYIDFHDNNKIKFLEDDSLMWESLKTVWTEVQPLIENVELPTSWEDAVDNYYEATNFEDGDDDKTNELLNNLGKLIILRDIYREGWVAPNDGTPFWYVGNHNSVLDICKGTAYSRLLSFENEALANKFLSTFEDIIEEVKEYI